MANEYWLNRTEWIQNNENSKIVYNLTGLNYTRDNHPKSA